MEYKNIPEEFLNKYLIIKAELKFEKIERGKDAAYISELEDIITNLANNNIPELKYLRGELEDKKEEIKLLKFKLSKLKEKSKLLY